MNCDVIAQGGFCLLDRNYSTDTIYYDSYTLHIATFGDGQRSPQAHTILANKNKASC